MSSNTCRVATMEDQTGEAAGPTLRKRFACGECPKSYAQKQTLQINTNKPVGRPKMDARGDNPRTPPAFKEARISSRLRASYLECQLASAKSHLERAKTRLHLLNEGVCSDHKHNLLRFGFYCKKCNRTAKSLDNLKVHSCLQDDEVSTVPQ